MQIKRMFVFALGFAVGALLFGGFSVLAQGGNVLTVRQALRAPLILDVQIPANDGTGSATITIGLDLASVASISGSTVLTNALTVVPSVDSAGAANVSVRLGDLPAPQISVEGSTGTGSTGTDSTGTGATSSTIPANAVNDVATTTLTNTRPVLTADQLSTLGAPVPVTNVIDGETIEVQIDGQPVRINYALVDAPDRDEPQYTESLVINSEFVTGQSVYLERDTSDVDRFGRLLRYVYLADGTLVNEVMVRLGYGWLSVDPPDVSRVGQIRTAQTEAQLTGSGVWIVPGAVPSARANNRANLRTGPGTSYDVVGSVETGDVLTVIGISTNDSWYQLENRYWIAASLVDGAPPDLPMAIEEASDYKTGSGSSGNTGGNSGSNTGGWYPTAPPHPTATYTPFVSNYNATPLPAVDPEGVVDPTATPTNTATPTPTATPTTPPCDPSYPQLCIPVGSPPLACDQIEIDNFIVYPPDPYNFDKDGDGLGCEDE